jgi:uncharacterized protein YjbI with pentapeptide repeats
VARPRPRPGSPGLTGAALIGIPLIGAALIGIPLIGAALIGLALMGAALTGALPPCEAS